MADKHLGAYAIYPTDLRAELAVQELRLSGTRDADMSLLLASPKRLKTVELERYPTPLGGRTAIGAGRYIGGTLRWLAGIGTISISGGEPLIAAGPVMTYLSNLSAEHDTGSLADALAGLGIPPDDAIWCAERIERGGVFLSVHTDSKARTKNVEAILEKTKGEDIGAVDAFPNVTPLNRKPASA